MSSPKDGPGPLPHVEVDDPAAAMQRSKDLARRVLAVPKPDADAKPTKGRTGNKKPQN